jgi:hypothetical protein
MFEGSSASKSPTQLAKEALEQMPQSNARVAPAPASSQVGQPIDNFENKKIEWIKQARRFNPSVDGDTLSKMYDQKIAPAEAEGSKPWIKRGDIEAQANAKIQGRAKKSLIPPDEESNQAFLHGIARGIKDIGQGAKQMYLKAGEHYDDLDKFLPTLPGHVLLNTLIKKQEPGTSQKYTDQVNEEIAEYEKKTENHSFVAGSGRLLGQIVSTLPLGAEGAIGEHIVGPLMQKVVSGGVAGLTIGGLSFDPTGMHRMFRAVTGGLLGSIIPGGLHGAGKVLKWLGGKVQLIDDPAVLEAAANRVKNAKELGIDQLTAGAATRDPVIQSAEAQILKKSGNAPDLFREAHQKISGQIYDAGQKMVDAMGGKVMANKVLGENIQTALESTKQLARSGISSMYTAAAEAPGAMEELSRKELLSVWKELHNDLPDLKLSKRIKREFKDLAEATKDGQTYQNNYNVKIGNRIIIGLNKMYQGALDGNQKFAIRKLSSSIMDSMDELADLEENPSRTLFNLARHYRKQLADIYDQKDIVAALIKQKSNLTKYISPEDVANRIFGSKENITNLNNIENALKYNIPIDRWMKAAKALNPKSDLSELSNIYSSKVKPLQEDNARLWDNLRASKISDILNKSTVYINGVAQLSYKSLVKHVKAMGEDSLNKVLGDRELASKFNKLINVMDVWQNKAPTIKTEEGAIKAIHKASSGIFGLIGDGESRIGGIIHFPFNIIRNIVSHINDERWVRANLRLGLQDSPQLVKVMKHSPHVINNIINMLKRNKMIRDKLRSAAVKSVVSGPLTPQSNLPPSQQQGGF